MWGREGNLLSVCWIIDCWTAAGLSQFRVSLLRCPPTGRNCVPACGAHFPELKALVNPLFEGCSILGSESSSDSTPVNPALADVMGSSSDELSTRSTPGMQTAGHPGALTSDWGDAEVICILSTHTKRGVETAIWRDEVCLPPNANLVGFDLSAIRAQRIEQPFCDSALISVGWNEALTRRHTETRD